MIENFKTILERFADKTSMHGVGQIRKSKLCQAKAMWIVLLLLALCFLTFHMYYLIYSYLQWPKTTTVSLGFDNLNIPSVTICNVNRIKNSRKSILPDIFRSFLEKVDQSNNISSENNHSQIGNRTVSQEEPRQTTFSGKFDNMDFAEYDENLADYHDSSDDLDTFFQVEEVFTSMYMDLDRKTRIQTGHALEDMLVSCSFNGIKCSTRNFSMLMSERYGMCYTVDNSKMVIQNPGPDHGLSMILFTDNEEYLSGITQGYGARLVLHGQNEFPLPRENGIFISSFSETDIGLNLMKISRLNGSYGDCNNGVHFFKTHEKQYTRQACLIVCEQSKILNTCGCYKKNFEDFFYSMNTSYRTCTSEQDYSCMKKMEKIMEQKKSDDFSSCNCVNPCEEDQYHITSSSRQWPTKSYAVYLRESICAALSPSTCEHLRSLDMFTLGYNFIKINIYFEDLNYEYIKEKPEIEESAFASDIGGALGLWIGLSFISVFEIIQLMLEICRGIHCSTNTKDIIGKQ